MLESMAIEEAISAVLEAITEEMESGVTDAITDEDTISGVLDAATEGGAKAELEMISEEMVEETSAALEGTPIKEELRLGSGVLEGSTDEEG